MPETAIRLWAKPKSGRRGQSPRFEAAFIDRQVD